MRSLAVALPAEQYFADTAAKMSPGSDVRAQAFLSGCPNVLRDTLYDSTNINPTYIYIGLFYSYILGL